MTPKALAMYPALTKAMGDEAKFLAWLPFDEIHDLAKLQATRGDDAARRQLQSLKQEQKRKAA